MCYAAHMISYSMCKIIGGLFAFCVAFAGCSPNDNVETTETTSTDTADTGGREGGVPVEDLWDSDPAEYMRQIVQKLSVDLFPRDWSHPDHLNEAAAFISQKLTATTGEVREQTYTVSGNTYRNVIATLGPETESRVVVGAHYDAVEAAPGADDNASGVAGLLYLAALLSKETLPVRVELVAFTLEEPPHFATPGMGSAVHAAALADDDVPLIAMFAIEMIGYFSDKAGTQSFPVGGLEAIYGDVGDFIAVIGRTDQSALVDSVHGAMAKAMTLRAEKLAAPPSLKGVDFSDHRSYWAQGWPAVMITDTAFYRNDNYHRPTDTIDTLDFAKSVQVVKGLCAAVLEVAK